MAKATVQLWQQTYNYQQSKYEKTKGELHTTDANGFFKIKKIKDENNNYRNNYYLMDVKHGNDRLFMNDLANDYYYNQQPQESKSLTSIHLFTDRAIYRPGQTVYYKGIVLTRNNVEKTGGVKAGYSTTVILRDANYKDLDTIKLTTNEFGSFNGKFQLPQTGMNGQFKI